MIKKFNDFYNNPYNINGTILFSDLKNSSLMWKDYPNETLKLIGDLNNLYTGYSTNHNGIIIKTIGDCFMLYFKTFRDSINFSVELQKYLINQHIKVGNIDVITRIGICYGPLIEKFSNIQNAVLRDFYGNTVNSASRLESNVSGDNGFAFGVKLKVDFNLEEIKDCHIQKIQYTDNPSTERRRSGRLLTDEHFFIERRDLSDLKGIDEILVYKCDLI